MDPIIALSAYAGKYQPQLLGQLYKMLALDADGIQVIPNVKNTLTLGRLRIGKGWKPYTGSFVANDQLKYSDRDLTVSSAQRDIEIEPEKYRTTWLSQFLSQTSDAATKEIPFPAFTWGEVMKETAQEIVEILYWGKGKTAFANYAAGTAYSVGALIAFTNTGNKNQVEYYQAIAATTAGQSPLTNPDKWMWAGNLAITKGYNAIIADIIANEGFNQIVSTGAITGTTAYDQFTSVWRKQNEQTKKNGGVIYCSYNSKELLTDDYENKIKKNFEETTDGVIYLAKTDRKCQIMPVEWLSASGRLIATPKNNLVLGTDALNDANKIQNIPTHYTLQSSMKMLLGLEFRDLDLLWINDQQ